MREYDTSTTTQEHPAGTDVASFVPHPDVSAQSSPSSPSPPAASQLTTCREICVRAGMHGVIAFLRYAAVPVLLLLALLHIAQLFFDAGPSWIHPSPALTTLLTTWATSELAFWVYARCQVIGCNDKRRAIISRPRSSGPAERQQLFRRCVGVAPDDQHVEGLLSGWFPNARFADLRRGNVEQWLAWAFFDSRWRDLTGSEQAEVEGYRFAIERRLGHALPDGFNPAIESMRLTLDPVVVAHRPLAYYVVLRTIDLANGVCLRSMGFSRHPVTNGAFAYWIYAPPAGFAHRRTQERIPPPPIVFLHGLGIGLAQYVHMILRLMRIRRPLLLVEISHISSQLHGTVPDRRDVVEGLQEMLNENGFSRGIFFGHSYGTIYVAWVIKLCPRILASAFLVDPIVFLLCRRDVCYNFLYRKPATWVELVLHYFAGREMHIAKTLGRHFRWADNVLWAEDVTMRTTVVLSESDRIVDAAAVRDYLASHADGACVRVVWLPRLHHAEFLFDGGVLRYVIDQLAEQTL